MKPQPHRSRGWLLPLHGLLTFILGLYVVSALFFVIATLGDYFLGGHPLAEILQKSPVAVQGSAWEVFSGGFDSANQLDAFMQGLPHNPTVAVSASDMAVDMGLRHPTALQLALKYLTFYPSAIAILPMLIVARRLIRAAHNQDPFTPAMIRRVQKLGLVVLLSGAGAELVECVAAIVLRNMVLPHPSPLIYVNNFSTISLWWLLPGLIILAFGEILKRGGQMRAELDEVI